MDKIKLLTLSVMILLVLNIGTLGFLVLSGGDHHRGPHQKPQQIIIEKLHFDAKQQEQYQKLIQVHHSTIDRLDHEFRDTKNRLYLQLIKTSADTKTKDSLVTALSDCQKQIELTHFKHFEDIKKLCKPEQLNDYYDLTTELSQLFSRRPPPKND